MKPQPRLQDMPFPIQRRIAGHLDFYVDKMSLRTACPKFRPIIGDPEFECRKLMLSINGSESSYLTFNQNSLKHERIYTQVLDGCQISIYSVEDLTYGELEREMLVKGGDLIDLMARDFEMLVTNPNFTVECFSIGWDWNNERISYENFLSKIESVLMKCKLKVKQFKMNDVADVLRFLPYLDSEALESLEVNEDSSVQRYEMDEIVKLEQFKKLQKLKLSDSPTLRIESWWHIPETKMTLRHLKSVEVKRLLEHFRRAPNFRQSELSTKLVDLDIVRALGGAKAQFQILNDFYVTYFPATKTKIGVVVDVKNGVINIRHRRNMLASNDSDDIEEAEEVDQNYEYRRFLETLKPRFCDSLVRPVFIGVEDGVVKHFEWDQESKAYQTTDCEDCRQSEEDLGAYGLLYNCQ